VKKLAEVKIEVELFNQDNIENEKLLNSDSFKDRLNVCNDIYQFEVMRMKKYKSHVIIKGIYQPEYHYLTIYSHAKVIDALQTITYSFNPEFYEEYERRVIYGGKKTLKIFQLLFETEEEQ
jgi:hypothetical protein